VGILQHTSILFCTSDLVHINLLPQGSFFIPLSQYIIEYIRLGVDCIYSTMNSILVIITVGPGSRCYHPRSKVVSFPDFQVPGGIRSEIQNTVWYFESPTKLRPESTITSRAGCTGRRFVQFFLPPTSNSAGLPNIRSRDYLSI
jgi:hypothetical protein